VQVIAAPDGRPIWTSGVRPGRKRDTTALRRLLHGAASASFEPATPC
jgi:hypothetical protein